MKDKQKLTNVIEGVVMVILGILIAIFGGVDVVDVYLAIIALVAGVLLAAICIARLVKNSTLVSNELIYSAALIGLGIALLTDFVTVGALVPVILVLIISAGAALVLLGIYSLAKKATTLGLVQLIVGAIAITLGLLYIFVDGFAQAFWIIVGIIVALLGILLVTSQFVDLKKSKKK